MATGIGAAPAPPAPPLACARALKCVRYEREGARVQREIDRLQESGGETEIDRLWQQKRDLIQRIAALGVSGT
jgi:hypothetical protein